MANDAHDLRFEGENRNGHTLVRHRTAKTDTEGFLKPDSGTAEKLGDQRNSSQQRSAPYFRGVHQNALLRRTSRWYSFAALLGAVLTPFVSLAILLGVRNDPG
jgi:hypothetical protein